MKITSTMHLHCKGIEFRETNRKWIISRGPGTCAGHTPSPNPPNNWLDPAVRFCSFANFALQPSTNLKCVVLRDRVAVIRCPLGVCANISMSWSPDRCYTLQCTTHFSLVNNWVVFQLFEMCKIMWSRWWNKLCSFIGIPLCLCQ